VTADPQFQVLDPVVDLVAVLVVNRLVRIQPIAGFEA